MSWREFYWYFSESKTGRKYRWDSDLEELIDSNKTISDDVYRLAYGLDSGLKQIPLMFMLGFFVSTIIGRWSKLFDNIGWIEKYVLKFFVP